MPSIMEISGLLSGGLGSRGLAFPGRAGISDLREALGVRHRGRKVRRVKVKKVRRTRRMARTSRQIRIGVRPVGPSCERMLEIAEAQYAKGNKALALAWSARAVKCAKAEGKPAVAQRAHELIKTIRGEALLKTAAGLNDVEAVFLAKTLGLI